MSSGWVATHCAVCGAGGGTRILEVRRPEATSWVVRCDCGLRRLDPRPSPETVGRYYGDDYNAYVGRRRGPWKQAIWDFLRDVTAGAPGRGRRFEALRPTVGAFAEWAFDINVRLSRRTPPSVIEIGCGYGDLLIYLASRGCRVQGVDYDARAAAEGARHGVPIHVGRLADLAAGDASFDAGVLCHSLEHLPDPRAELLELARVLRPGAPLHIAVPNGASSGLAREGLEWPHLSHPVHFWFFDRPTLHTLLAQTGFEPVRTYATSRGRALLRIPARFRAVGAAAAAREALAMVVAELAAEDAGDVLRVIARRRRG